MAPKNFEKKSLRPLKNRNKLMAPNIFEKFRGPQKFGKKIVIIYQFIIFSESRQKQFVEPQFGEKVHAPKDLKKVWHSKTVIASMSHEN